VDDFFQGKISTSQKLQSAWGNSRSKKQFFFATPNPEIVLAAQSNAALKKVLNTTQLSVADGTGILWASYFLNLKRRNFITLITSLFAILFTPKKIRKVISERVTGSDLFPNLLSLAAKRKKKVFLLGAAPNVAAIVKEKFEKKIQNLKISGVYSGSPLVSVEDEIRAKIDASKAELLFVAFGAPQQELWIARNLPRLKTVKFAMGVGGTFDFYAGIIRRAPHIFCHLGLEWLWRLVLQPRRLGRIWNATFCFVRMVWKNRC
jgi:N-acetylglucosaminyldiphosphoundecaprenol N-acetyl-beta-D-mannosaminyltransferase